MSGRMQRLFVKEKSFYQLILSIAVPVVLQNMITIGVNIMDTMMLGSYGEVQLSASSLANEFINIYHIMCMGMSMGAAVLTAQYYGMQDMTNFKKTVTIMLRMGLVIAAIFTAVTLLIPDALMRLYTPDEAVIEMGVKYFRISAVTYVLLGVSLMLTNIMRTVRLVKFPLILSVVTFCVNVFFNWVFIYGNLGAPEMQIEGAAIGTVIARVVECASLVTYFFFIDKKIGYRLRNLFMKCGDLVKTYVTYAIPVMISDTLLALGNSAVSIIMGYIGTNFVAANSIISQTVRLSTVFNQGLSSASSVITGNTLGRGERDKAYHQGVTFLTLSVLIGIAAAVIILVISPLIVESFNVVQETKQIAYQLMYSVSIMMVFQTVQSVLTKGVLRGGGDTKFLMMADILFLWLASIPLGALCGLVWHCSPFVIYAALKVDWIIKSIWCVFRLRSKKWIKVVDN